MLSEKETTAVNLIRKFNVLQGINTLAYVGYNLVIKWFAEKQINTTSIMLSTLDIRTLLDLF